AKPAPAAKPAAAPAAESGGDLILYVVFITLGIILGYYVLVWAAPAANFLRLNLPGLPPVSSGDVSPATPAASPETSQLSPPSSLPHAYDSAATRLVAGDAAAPLKDGSRVSAPRA
ncbi:MAG TPA: hypothetical protein VGE52_17620, partial [Pirellulales bacterium]